MQVLRAGSSGCRVSLFASQFVQRRWRPSNKRPIRRALREKKIKEYHLFYTNDWNKREEEVAQRQKAQRFRGLKLWEILAHPRLQFEYKYNTERQVTLVHKKWLHHIVPKPYMCPDWKHFGECPRGEECQFLHAGNRALHSGTQLPQKTRGYTEWKQAVYEKLRGKAEDIPSRYVVLEMRPPMFTDAGKYIFPRAKGHFYHNNKYLGFRSAPGTGESESRGWYLVQEDKLLSLDPTNEEDFTAWEIPDVLPMDETKLQLWRDEKDNGPAWKRHHGTERALGDMDDELRAKILEEVEARRALAESEAAKKKKKGRRR